MKNWKSDQAQRALLSRASHLLKFFFKGDKRAKDEAVSALMDASRRVMAHMKTKATFISMFEPINTVQLGKAAEIAEHLSLNMKSDGDPTMALVADANACLAVLCKNRLNQFNAASDVKVAELIAELLGAGIASKRFGGYPSIEV
ncbi:MAG: hypothetical protein ACXWBP_12410 [Limisphaerales bacterium]